MTKPKKQQLSEREVQRRNRQRALPLPNAIAWTIADYQALGGAGKTSLYAEDKRRKENGEKPLLFKDAVGRTMVDGDLGRELLGVTDAVAA